MFWEQKFKKFEFQIEYNYNKTDGFFILMIGSSSWRNSGKNAAACFHDAIE